MQHDEAGTLLGATPQSLPPVRTNRRRPFRSLWEWVWRADALSAAQTILGTAAARRRLRVRCAEQAFEAAERVFDPVQRLPAGETLWLAVSLYGQAARLLLVSSDEMLPDDDVSAALARADRAVLAGAAGGVDQLEVVRSALVENSLVFTESPLSEQRTKAAAVRSFVASLLERERIPLRRVDVIRWQRWWRASIALALMALALGTLGVRVARALEKPDLARGKPWRTSSSAYTCAPEKHTCADVATDILFHTHDEHSPWFEVDLGAPRSISVVEVTNRGDCCGDRAVPLVVEVSDNQVSWREIARRSEAFSFWRVRFGATPARYVRVRAPRKTVLHLEKVAVR